MDVLRRETGRGIASPRWSRAGWWLVAVVSVACVVGGVFCALTLAFGHRTSGTVQSCTQFANNGQVYDANKTDNTTCRVSLDVTHRLVTVTTSGKLSPGSTVRLIDSVIGPQQVSGVEAGTAAIAVGIALVGLLWWLGYPAFLWPRVRWLSGRRRAPVS